MSRAWKPDKQRRKPSRAICKATKQATVARPEPAPSLGARALPRPLPLAPEMSLWPLLRPSDVSLPAPSSEVPSSCVTAL